MPELTPAPFGLSKKSAISLGEKFSEIIGYSPGDELEPIVQKLGGVIKEQNFDEWLKGNEAAIIVHGPEKFEIFIPSFSSKYRNRFTIAHELGHYILHSRLGERKITVYRFATPNENTQVEREANWFAVGFLMPRKFLDEDFKMNTGLLSISAKYGVSPLTLEIRKKELTIETSS